MRATSRVRILVGDEAMRAFGERLGTLLEAPCVVFLQGDLGAGKTTLSQGILRGLGHSGRVKSPTYTLVEPYELGDRECYHFDLYRLGSPEELEFLGVRDLLGPRAIALIEWPQRGMPLLPPADLRIDIETIDEGDARRLTLTGPWVDANTDRLDGECD